MFTRIFDIARVAQFAFRVIANVATFLADQIQYVIQAVEQNNWQTQQSQYSYPQ